MENKYDWGNLGKVALGFLAILGFLVIFNHFAGGCGHFCMSVPSGYSNAVESQW